MPKILNYVVLDSKRSLKELARGTAKEIAEYLDTTIENVAKLNRTYSMVFDRYYVVATNESDNKPKEEEWNVFKETEDTLYYVSDRGRVKAINVATLEQHIIKPVILSNHKEAVVKIEEKYYYLKLLVFKYHCSRLYKKGIEVICKDGNETNCSVCNLKVK